MLKVKTYKILINLQQTAKSSCHHRLGMKQREEKPTYFVIHSTAILSLVKVGSNVLDDDNKLMNGVLKQKKRKTHFYATFVLL